MPWLACLPFPPQGISLFTFVSLFCRTQLLLGGRKHYMNKSLNAHPTSGTCHLGYHIQTHLMSYLIPPLPRDVRKHILPHKRTQKDREEVTPAQFDSNCPALGEPWLDNLLKLVVQRLCFGFSLKEWQHPEKGNPLFLAPCYSKCGLWTTQQHQQHLGLVGNAGSQPPPGLRNQTFNKNAYSGLSGKAFRLQRERKEPWERVRSGKTSEVIKSTLNGRCSFYLLISKLIIIWQSTKEKTKET